METFCLHACFHLYMTHLECFHFVMWELFCLHMYVHVSVTHLDGLILPYGDFRLTCVLSSICDSSRRFNFVVWRLSAYMYTFICMPPITGICERAFTICKPQNRLLKPILEKAEGKCGAARQLFKGRETEHTRLPSWRATENYIDPRQLTHVLEKGTDLMP